MATSREIFTAFGATAIAQWATGNMVHDAPHIEVAINVAYNSAGTGWTGDAVFVAEMPTEGGFSFDVDPSGRWWICFTDSSGAMHQYYSDDSGGTWTQSV